jgi:hypothetical protein
VDFVSLTPVSPANFYSTDCFTLLIIYHAGLVQQAKQWLTYRVDSVSPHPKKKKTFISAVLLVMAAVHGYEEQCHLTSSSSSVPVALSEPVSHQN